MRDIYIEDLQEIFFNDEKNAKEVIYEKLEDLETPGYQTEFDPFEADQVGAFGEDAISEIDALESTYDLPEKKDKE